MIYRRRIRLLLSLLLWSGFWGPLAATDLSAGLQLRETPRWGLDGMVRIGQFNLLTVQVQNDGDQPWRGEFRLELESYVSSLDLPIIEPDLIVEAAGSRTVQFLVFASTDRQYRLVWGTGGEARAEVGLAPLTDQPAMIQLVSEDDRHEEGHPVPGFPETDFPFSAAGLEALGVVFLDHLPHWNDFQSRAFRDWLFAGGTLHLFHDAEDQFPAFSGLLTDLNDPAAAFPFGQGQVIRHARPFSQQELPVTLPSADALPDEPVIRGEYPLQENRAIFLMLRKLTQPQHSWQAIFAMACLYLLLLFPGCWLLAKWKKNAWLTYGSLLGVVFLFSVGFRAAGSQGHEKESTLDSVAVAVPTADGRSLVRQWNNLYVTTGGRHTLSHPAEGLTYSTGQMSSNPSGFVINRPRGMVLVDIPSLTSQTLAHVGIVDDPGSRIRLLNVRTSGQHLESLELETTGETVEESIAVWGNHAYRLRSAADNRLQLDSGPLEINSLIQRNSWNEFQLSQLTEDVPREEAFYRKLYEPLLAQALNLHSQKLPAAPPKGELRVLLYVPMPATYLADPDQYPRQRGRVLRCLSFQIE